MNLLSIFTIVDSKLLENNFFSHPLLKKLGLWAPNNSDNFMPMRYRVFKHFKQKVLNTIVIISQLRTGD